MTRYINTEEASKYLLETYNISFTPKSLRQARTVGQGPPYNKLGRRVYYTIEQLDAWVHTGMRIIVGKHYRRVKEVRSR